MDFAHPLSPNLTTNVQGEPEEPSGKPRLEPPATKAVEGSQKHLLTGVASVLVVFGEYQSEPEDWVLVSPDDLLESRHLTGQEPSKRIIVFSMKSIGLT
jgi:hypothetical protein